MSGINRIAEARRRLPLPMLMADMGLARYAKRSANCPFHSDQSPSFGIFQGEDGRWRWRCFAGCGGGDEVDFLARARHVGPAEAARMFLALAGVRQ